MSKLKYLVLPILLCLALAGCAREGAQGEWSALQLAREVAAGATEDVYELTPGDSLYDEYVTRYYGLDARSVMDGAVITAGFAQEVAVLRFESEMEAGTAAASLESYLRSRVENFRGYMPGEAAMLESAQVVTSGEWCALIALPDAASGAETFTACLSSEPPAYESASPDATSRTPVPEQTAASGTEDEDWTYSEQRIISAYRSGNWSGLHEYDRAILEIVEYVLADVAPAGLSDYERELAIHDYIIENAEYDSDALGLLPVFEPDPNNSNPYGTLVNGRAVCRGYSSTFQLFMDLIGVECITVDGQGNLARDEHAWNMVRLGGEWYCVDVTWDDPITFGGVSDYMAHRYFNVTSEFMRSTHHYWDADGVPEADGTRYAWTEA